MFALYLRPCAHLVWVVHLPLCYVLWKNVPDFVCIVFFTFLLSSFYFWWSPFDHAYRHVLRPFCALSVGCTPTDRFVCVFLCVLSFPVYLLTSYFWWSFVTMFVDICYILFASACALSLGCTAAVLLCFYELIFSSFVCIVFFTFPPSFFSLLVTFFDHVYCHFCVVFAPVCALSLGCTPAVLCVFSLHVYCLSSYCRYALRCINVCLRIQCGLYAYRFVCARVRT